ncbi:MAG TPA: hypothetical protein VJ798_02020 [Rhizomicrobium sp.]|nr:hypothetical protein [Rhizomicrobium sp.]
MGTQESWSRCRPWIEAAIATGPGVETIDDVERLLACGRYQFWAGRAAAAITEITEFQRRKILTVMHGGGDLAELLDEIEPALCAFAREQGCDGIMGLGRKGWERVTQPRGYRLAYIAMIKDLDI